MEDDNFKLFFKSKLFYSFVHPIGKELMLKIKLKGYMIIDTSICLK